MKIGIRPFDLAQDKLPALGNSKKLKLVIYALCAMLFALCGSVDAQQSGKIFRIGILRTGQPPKTIEMLRWALRRES